jgi:hypothetical protein
MKHSVIVALLALLLVLVAVAVAQPTYGVSWWTVDGGGQSFGRGGVYSLGGTIGQSDSASLAAGQYAIRGGFWARAAVGRAVIYAPVVLSGL